jgi:hypothetical protein
MPTRSRALRVTFLLLSAACGGQVAPGAESGPRDAGVDRNEAPFDAAEAARDVFVCTVSCDGSCTDTNTDPNNCGACGHNCLGGACVAGQCQPVILSANQSQPTFLTLDGDSTSESTFRRKRGREGFT